MMSRCDKTHSCLQYADTPHLISNCKILFQNSGSGWQDVIEGEKQLFDLSFTFHTIRRRLVSSAVLISNALCSSISA